MSAANVVGIVSGVIGNKVAPAFLIIAIVAATSAVGLSAYRLSRHAMAQAHPSAPVAQVVVQAAPTAEPAPSTVPSPTPTPAPTPLPDSVFIKVPYTPQAPTGNWDAAHEEYCEAAAALMVGRYYQNQKYPGDRIPPADADAAMGQIVAYERQSWPGVLDLSLARVALVAQHFYNLDATIGPATLAGVKRAIASGQPVLIPVMTHGGPGGARIAAPYGSVSVYHVMVITGYDSQKLYTNDPGFVQGQNWAYTWDVLQLAMTAQESKMGQPSAMLTFRPRS